MTTPQPAAYPAALTGRLDPALTRWGWLFKWMLAVPHYVVLWLLGIVLVVVTLSAGLAFTSGVWAGLSLVTIAAIVATLVLLFTGVYRMGPFDFLMGLNRWNFRTVVYAALLRDEYPPFRFDQGAIERPAHA